MLSLKNFLLLRPLLGKKALGLAAGIAGALIIAYCIHFDGQRRADPNYKKKVHQRRHRREVEDGRLSGGRGSESGTDPEHKQVEDESSQGQDDDVEELNGLFLLELHRGEDLIKEGRIDAGLDHLINAMAMCAHPTKVMLMLHEKLQPEVFTGLMAKLQEVEAAELEQNKQLGQQLHEQLGIGTISCFE